MPIQYPSINRFNGGVWSPKLHGRIELDDYNAALKKMRGFIPLKYGEAQAMTGFLYGEETKHNNRDSVLIPFQFSANDSFWLELGHLHMRIVNPSDGTYVMDGGSPVEIATTYDESDLFDLHYHQLNDLVIITHEGYEPMEIVRISDISWTISAYQQDYPALLDTNTATANKLSFNAGTLAATGGHTPFTVNHVGSYWAIEHTRDASETIQTLLSNATSASIPTKGNWFLYTKYPIGSIGTEATATVSLQRSVDSGSTWASIRERTITVNDIAIDFNGSEEEEDVLYRIVTSGTDAGADTGHDIVFAVDEAQVTGTCKVTVFGSSTSVTATEVKSFESTSASSLWQEGGWSAHQGYPRAATVFNQRVIFGGTTQSPTAVWMSAIDDISNFNWKLTGDSDAIFINIDNSQNAIQWLAKKDRIFAGTSSEEFGISSTSLQEPITPKNVTAKVHGGNGSSRVQPINLGDSIIFNTFNGIQIRELSYQFSQDNYTSETDVTELSDDITGTGVRQMTYQQYPNRTIYSVTNEGDLIGLVWDKQNEVKGWFDRKTDGEFVSAVSTRGSSINDPLGVITKRTIDGTEKRFIEVLAVPSDTNNEWVYLDAAVEVASLGGTTITGYPHLTGKTVRVMNDGALETNKLVVAGGFELDRVSNTNVVFGLDFDAECITLPITASTGDGNPSAKLKKISHLYIAMRQSLAGHYGWDVQDSKGVQVSTDDSIFPADSGTLIMGQAQAPVTREYRLPMQGGHYRSISLRFKRVDPVPLNITHAIPAIAANGD